MNIESTNVSIEPAKHQFPVLPHRDAIERHHTVDLITRMAEGDEEALTEFYDLLSPTLYGLALKMITDEEESADVLQEAFVSIWREAGAYHSALGSPFAWAVMILRKKAIDRLRKRQRFEAAPVESSRFGETEGCYRGDQVHHEESSSVRSALSQLPGEQRQALELAFFSGMTHLDIARQLATSPGTINTYIRQGLLHMRTLMSQAY